jgi:hypothetical protein
MSAVALALVSPLAWLSCGGHVAGAGTGDASPGPATGGALDATLGDDGSAGSGEGVIACGQPGSSCAFDDAGVPVCDGKPSWGCAVVTACDGSLTTLTGRVFDPLGQNPVRGAVVYIPTLLASIAALTPGTTSCGCPRYPVMVAAAATDPQGRFTLRNVPTARGIPLVVEVGKWRRVFAIDVSNSCGSTALPDGTLRLPRNRLEGDLPQMAVLTGGADDLGCFLRRVGVDASEYSAPHGGGRVDVYRGLSASSGATPASGPGLSRGTAGDCTTAACPLWASRQALEAYDTILLGCEGDPFAATKPAAAAQAMQAWLLEGGRLFAFHSQASWLAGATAFAGIAPWKPFSAATASGFFRVATSSPSGVALREWLDGVDAAAEASIDLAAVSDTVGPIVSVTGPASPWIDDPGDSGDPSAPPGDPKLLSVLTPIGGADAGDAAVAGTRVYCGKAVFSDVHVGAAPSGDVPDSCPTGPLTPEEKALEFQLFDPPTCAYSPPQPHWLPGG